MGERSFDVGDAVWLYRPPLVHTGTILRTVSGVPKSWYVSTLAYGEQICGAHRLFHRPGDADALADELRDEAAVLSHQADTIERQQPSESEAGDG